MDAHYKSLPLRLAVVLVLVLLHGGLILVFLHDEPAHMDLPASPEVPTLLFFIEPAPVRELQRPKPARGAPLATRDFRRRSYPDVKMARPDTAAPAAATDSTALPPVDWSAEAHRAAAAIASRRQYGAPAESPSSSPSSAPWDSRPLLESSSHGLTVRIPVEIPGDIIDHCFGKVDFVHEQTGQSQRFQLGCALRKQPARGDLFDSLRKPTPPK